MHAVKVKPHKIEFDKSRRGENYFRVQILQSYWFGHLCEDILIFGFRVKSVKFCWWSDSF